MFLLLLPAAVTAVDQCTNTPQLFHNCTAVTDPLTCDDYHYNVTNMTGHMIENGTLVVHNADLSTYRYNFTHTNTAKDYQVVLCDNSTQFYNVGGADGVNPVLFIFLPFLVSALLFVLAFSLDAKEHLVVRAFIGIFSLSNILVGMWIAFIVNIDFVGSSSLEDALSTYLWVLLLAFFGLFAYMSMYLIVKFLKSAGKTKLEELRY